MPAKIKYKIGSVTIARKKDVIARIREIFRLAKLGAPLTGFDAELADWLLTKHPYKDAKLQGRRIAYYTIGQNNGSTCFIVELDNGGREHFSYKRALGLK
ncbi:MAG TPA: DUF3223 domain-containing protein [Xanthobacteraceae bacterium]|nr:DUF3223 domain-containing protein [Xanthobacteraceae bacterium]